MSGEREPVLVNILISSLEEALARMAAAAHIHTSIEPSLTCIRAADGRRRWQLDIYKRRGREHDE